MLAGGENLGSLGAYSLALQARVVQLYCYILYMYIVHILYIYDDIIISQCNNI